MISCTKHFDFLKIFFVVYFILGIAHKRSFDICSVVIKYIRNTHSGIHQSTERPPLNGIKNSILDSAWPLHNSRDQLRCRLYRSKQTYFRKKTCSQSFLQVCIPKSATCLIRWPARPHFCLSLEFLHKLSL